MKNASFADAALRMGNVYAKGIDEEPDPTIAWYYYVQADYVAKIRAKNSDFFGNTTVVINIQKALEEMRKQIPDDYLQEHMEYPVPYLFSRLTENNNKCELSKAVNAGGHTELIARRITSRSIPDPDDILVTIPQLYFCVRTADLSYTVDDTAEIWFKDDAECARFDYT